MNSVDRADHLRTNYALGQVQGPRQRKWQWLIFLLVFEVAIVDS